MSSYDGMGDGLLPLILKDYPSTNLLQPGRANSVEEIRDAVFWGGAYGRMSELSPPWGDELSCSDLSSVAMFVNHLRENTESALALLNSVRATQLPSLKLGRLVYQTRCALCHGRTGEGDGKMANFIKDPPPYNLTASVMPDVYLRMIVGNGGAA